jgi:hypothetical protein
MSIAPIITFKAGRCEINVGFTLSPSPGHFANNDEKQSTRPWTVKADPTPGYIYLYLGDEDGGPILPSNLRPLSY